MGIIFFLRVPYWIPGSYVPILSEKHNSFLWLLKNKGFKEGRVTKIKLYAIGASKTLESNKSQEKYVGGHWQRGAARLALLRHRQPIKKGPY
jgi:hypothetical protein